MKDSQRAMVVLNLEMYQAERIETALRHNTQDVAQLFQGAIRGAYRKDAAGEQQTADPAKIPVPVGLTTRQARGILNRYKQYLDSPTDQQIYLLVETAIKQVERRTTSSDMQLFSGTDTLSAKSTLLGRLTAEINGYSRDYILSVNVKDVVAHLVDKYHLELPRIDFASKEIVDEGEAGRGSYVAVAFPFEGSKELLGIQPTTWLIESPEAAIGDGEFRITYRVSAENRGRLLQEIDRDVRVIETNLKHIENDWKNFDDELRSTARLCIEQRRNKLVADVQFVENLGIPIRRRTNMPTTYPVPAVRRKSPVPRPTTAPPAAPDPTLELAEYDHILEIISNMEKVMERSPKAFAHMEEEHLRDHILVHLNGHYEGQATGETFNFEGKTDILIRARGGNIFIAECKFWQGKKVYLETIDQLLRYVTWRDAKTAIILFNRRKDFTAVLAQIPDATREHPNHVCQIEYRAESAFRFVMKNANNSGRQFLMTVLAFDVPS